MKQLLGNHTEGFSLNQKEEQVGNVKTMLRLKEGVGPHYAGRGQKMEAGDMVEEEEVGKGARDKFESVKVSVSGSVSIADHPSARPKTAPTKKEEKKKGKPNEAETEVREEPKETTPRFVMAPREGAPGLFNVVSTETGEALNVKGLTESEAKELLDDEKGDAQQ